MRISKEEFERMLQAYNSDNTPGSFVHVFNNGSKCLVIPIDFEVVEEKASKDNEDFKEESQDNPTVESSNKDENEENIPNVSECFGELIPLTIPDQSDSSYAENRSVVFKNCTFAGDIFIHSYVQQDGCYDEDRDIKEEMGDEDYYDSCECCGESDCSGGSKFKADGIEDVIYLGQKVVNEKSAEGNDIISVYKLFSINISGAYTPIVRVDIYEKRSKGMVLVTSSTFNL